MERRLAATNVTRIALEVANAILTILGLRSFDQSRSKAEAKLGTNEALRIMCSPEIGLNGTSLWSRALLSA